MMSPLGKIEKVICSTFILWLVSTFFYSLFILESRQQAFASQVNVNVLTNTQETGIFQRERGSGSRRTRTNSGRNILKASLNDRTFDKGLS
jgi:K+-transporting ATPase c subunit